MSETLFYGKPISEANIFKLIEAYSSMRNNPHEATWYVNAVMAVETEIIRRQSRIATLEAALRAMVEESPLDGNDMLYTYRCHFCNRESDDYNMPHLPDCPWVKAKEALGNGGANG